MRFPYVAGEMANGIATERDGDRDGAGRHARLLRRGGARLRAGRAAVDELDARSSATASPWGVNLIHSPDEPRSRTASPTCSLARGVQRISASAFMASRPPSCAARPRGCAVDAQGRIVRRHHLFAKISRPEVAAQFMSPAPRGHAARAGRSGQAHAGGGRAGRARAGRRGHHRRGRLRRAHRQPAAGRAAADRSSRCATSSPRSHGYQRPIRVGAAGGLGTPAARRGGVRARRRLRAHRLGQPGRRRGRPLGRRPRRCSREAGIADVAMAPAADMFELGVKVQVLKRGTMFARARATALRALPRVRQRSRRSRPTLRAELETRDASAHRSTAIWDETEAFWARTRPGRGRARRARPEAPDGAGLPLVPRHVEPLGDRRRRRRRADYQIWCGPAMGAFNALGRRARSSKPRRDRTVVQIALNLLEGAAVVTRAQQLRSFRRRRCPRARSTSGPRPLRLRRAHALTIDAAASMPNAPARQTPIAVVGVERAVPGLHDARAASGATSSRAGTCITDVPRDALADRGLLRPGPGSAGQDLRDARRLPAAGRLRPARVRHAADAVAGDRHGAAARADRRQAGARRTRRSGRFANDRPRAHQRHPRRHLGDRAGRARWSAGCSARCGSRRCARRASPRPRCSAICDAHRGGYVPWQENTFPGLLGNVVAGRIANRLDLGGTNCVVDAACASSLAAVVDGRRTSSRWASPTW